MTLSLVNRSNGEITQAIDARSLLAAAGIDDPRDATIVDLAEFTDNTRELASIAAEARKLVSDELIRRLDQSGRWTWRGAVWEVKAPSPEAGTVRYHTHLLRDALAQLVADGVISEEGARSAVALDVHTVEVSYGLLHGLLTVAKGPMLDELHELLADEPAASYHQRPAGIRGLLKIPAARAAIEACRLPATPPPRTARVRRVTP
jgi:hypothetical protein